MKWKSVVFKLQEEFVKARGMEMDGNGGRLLIGGVIESPGNTFHQLLSGAHCQLLAKFHVNLTG